MFSTFPDGWPGAGLLLLRAAGGAVFITQGVAYLGNRHLGLLMLAVISLMIAVGFLLVIGFLTRFVAVVAALLGMTGVLSLFPRSTVGPLENPITAVLLAVIAIAVICMGAGALSIDARMFGRREIVIPTNPDRELGGSS